MGYQPSLRIKLSLKSPELPSVVLILKAGWYHSEQVQPTFAFLKLILSSKPAFFRPKNQDKKVGRLCVLGSPIARFSGITRILTLLS